MESLDRYPGVPPDKPIRLPTPLVRASRWWVWTAAVNNYGIATDVWIRVAVAVVLGGIIGLQREIDDQQAGLRTHLSVCLGAALFGIVSTVGFDEFADQAGATNVRIDVTRVASHVVVGIGFVGSGLIIRRGSSVRNLTTAVSLWVTAAVGVAVGVGDIGIGTLTAAALLVALALFRIPREWIRRRWTERQDRVRVGLHPSADPEEIERFLSGLPDVTAELLSVQKHDGVLECQVEVTAAPGCQPGLVVRPLTERPDVEFVILEDTAFAGTTGLSDDGG